MSLVGRMGSFLRGLNWRERNVPAMMRMVRRSWSSDSGKVVAALPVGRQRAESSPQVVLAVRVFGQRKGLLASGLEEFLVAQWIGNVKTHFAGLARAEKFAWSSDLQIGFGN